ncbi:hypothetical protein C8D88_103233 [Lentzea atacamensis]|uniref:Uncharacterized protein n=1 Tax=Lentzea atacamensis TaxID=531938 RepID=A0A316I6D4_9PSEU|nr:hypothetical protein [Lentzea atacamensis]PWK88037.1 hypothetical protein C8D88_103233 [Lentzea atacamensis]RAS71243.1 hypothetical protein C8D87_1011544 [Lentzea atacamensis]
MIHAVASEMLVRRTEQWFVRQGAPTMIEGYGFRSHVLPRMLPALTFVAVGSLAWLVLQQSAGLPKWVLLGVIVAVMVAAWILLSLFVRRLPSFSPRTTVVLLIAYAAMPVIVPLLQYVVNDKITTPGAEGPDYEWWVVPLWFVTFFGLAFLATMLATTYGLGALLKAAIRHVIADLRNSVHLLGRALPPMLFVTLFLFFTGELWQAMNRLKWPRVSLIVLLFAAITVLAAAARLRDEIGRVEQDLRPEILTVACKGTPLAGVEIAEPLQPKRLNGRQLRNLLVMLAIRQLVQAAVVGLALFAFFVLLGLIVVTPDIATQWIGAPPEPSMIPGVPSAMLRNATLFAAFGSMYFSVISMSDAEHRRQFFAPVLEKVERTLEVRAVYLAVRERVQA